MIYFIVTTSLFKNCDMRKSQYINGISKLKQVINNLGIKNYKIIIVENNDNKNTFLDTLGCTTFYTKNNFLKTRNRGYKELQDILDCIDEFNIDDTDFVVKMTGRYVLDDNSEFMNIVKDLDKTKYDCIIKYGWYKKPSDKKIEDCITGIIGMTCGFIKKIEKPKEREAVEWNWAKVTYLMKDENIYKVDKLGINICPGYEGTSNRYRKV